MPKFNEAIRKKIVNAVNDVNKCNQGIVDHFDAINDCRKKRTGAFGELTSHCPHRTSSDISEPGSLAKVTLTRYFCKHSNHVGKLNTVRCQIYQCPLVDGGKL